MNNTDYWEECISYALDEVGIVATPKQIKSIARDVEVSHENFGMAFGHDAIPDPRKLEVEKLKKELKDEQDKVICTVCKGTGNETSYGGSLMSTSQCWKCKGEGRHKP